MIDPEIEPVLQLFREPDRFAQADLREGDYESEKTAQLLAIMGVANYGTTISHVLALTDANAAFTEQGPDDTTRRIYKCIDEGLCSAHEVSETGELAKVATYVKRYDEFALFDAIRNGISFLSGIIVFSDESGDGSRIHPEIIFPTASHGVSKRISNEIIERIDSKDVEREEAEEIGPFIAPDRAEQIKIGLILASFWLPETFDPDKSYIVQLPLISTI